MRTYILDENKKPVACTDMREWTKFREGNRMVARTVFGDVVVSTIFLGTDHSYGRGRPLLFETMVFGGEHDDYQERYHTWEEAVEGHRLACEMVDKVSVQRAQRLEDLGI